MISTNKIVANAMARKVAANAKFKPGDWVRMKSEPANYMHKVTSVSSDGTYTLDSNIQESEGNLEMFKMATKFKVGDVLGWKGQGRHKACGKVVKIDTSNPLFGPKYIVSPVANPPKGYSSVEREGLYASERNMTKIAANSRACNADVRIIKTIAGFQVVGVPDAPRFKTLVEAKKWCYDKGINPADVKLPQTGGTYVGSAKGSYMNSKACNAKFNVGDRVKVVSGGTLKGKVGRISDGPIYDTLGSFYTVDTHDGRSEDIPEDCIVKASNSAACNADVDYAALGRDLKSAIASAGFKPEFDTECAAIFAFRKDGGEMTQADVQKVKAAVKAVLRKNGSDVNAMRGPDKWIKACWIPFDGEMFIGGPKVALNEDDVVGNSVQITKDSRSTSFWIYGKVGQYTFEAKVYDDPSEYGIDNGRVSKLYMADKDRKCVANYDRGWDVRPKGNEVKAAYKELVAKLNTLPKALNSSVSTNAVVRRAMNAVQTAKPGDYLVFHSRRAGLPGAYYYKALKQNEGDSVLVEDLYGRFTSAPGGKIYDSMKRLEPTTKADASPVRVRINLLPDAYKGDYRAKLNIISSLRGEMESAGYKIINPSGADVGAELPKGELAALKKYCGKYYTVEQI